MIGHSLGEWAAGCLAGVFSLEDALELVAARGRLMDALREGAMLSVPLPERDVAALLRENLELSGVNAPSLCSVSGPVREVAQLRTELEARGILCKPVDATRAFHSSALEPVARELTRLVAGVERRPPTVPFVSNRTGLWITPEQAVDPEYWGFQVSSPVRFGDGMAELLRSGTEAALLEIGPGGSLGSLARRQPELLGQRPVLSSLPRPREGAPEELEPVSLLTALGRFWAAGGAVDWEGFQKGRRRLRTSLPTYPFERRRYWVDLPPADPALAEAAFPALPHEPATAAGELSPRPGYDRPDLEQPFEAPRTEAERRLAGLWTQVLGIDRIGIHDDFHEIGGDSLRALDLLARVSAEFGAKLPLRALLEAATVAGMAALLPAATGEEAPAPWKRRLPGGLVCIQEGNQEGDGRTPLFLVHPAGGHVLGYRPLAGHLGAQQPVYGLEAQGVQPGESPCETIEEMAAGHVAALLELGLRGPVALGGASMGGTVAWEMARGLREHGERVALVALFDTPGPGQIERGPADDAEVLIHLGAGHLGLTAGQLRQLAPERQLAWALERAAEAGVVPSGLDLAQATRLVELFKIHVQAMLRYRPPAYDGRVVFFRAAERRPADPPHPELGWIDLAGAGIEVHVVPGDHGTLYLPPHVGLLARRLRRCLEESR